MRLVAHRSLSAIGLVNLWCSLAFASFIISPPGPTLEQCSQVDLVWTEEPPIRLFVVPNREVAPGGPILENLGEIDQSFLLWTVDLPVGQNVSFTYVRVAAQYILLSSPQQYTVVEGSTSSCLTARTSSSIPAEPQPTQAVAQESDSWTLDPPQIAGVTLAAVGLTLILVCVVWRVILVRRHLRMGGTLTLFVPAKMSSKNKKEGAASTTDGAASTADGAPATEPRTRKFKVVSARPAMMYTLAEQKNKEETVTDLEKGAAVPPAQPAANQSDEALNEKAAPVSEDLMPELRYGSDNVEDVHTSQDAVAHLPKQVQEPNIEDAVGSVGTHGNTEKARREPTEGSPV